MTPHHVKRFEDAVEKLERVKWWQWTAIVAIQFITTGGCFGYVQHARKQDNKLTDERIALLEVGIAKLKEDRYTVTRILAMMKEDPKNFSKIDAQIEAIQEYERNRRTPSTTHRGRR